MPKVKATFTRAAVCFSLLPVLLLTVFFAVIRVGAEDTEPAETTASEPSGPTSIDPFTGNVDNGYREKDGRIALTDAVLFDTEQGMFVYLVKQAGTASGLENVSSSVMDGMIVTDRVRIAAKVPDSVHLFKDGTELPTPTGVFEDYGNYTVKQSVGGEDVVLFTFSIVKPLTNKVDIYNLPAGFALISLIRDGEEVDFSDRSLIDFTTDGEYIAAYRCPAADLNYSLRITVDRTPPVLALAALDSNGKASGPVDISDIEPGSSVTVTLNGKPVDYAKQLTKSGDYTVKISDKAGNTTVYKFTIRIYFNPSAIVSVIIIVLIIIALIAYIYLSRKKLRIR